MLRVNSFELLTIAILIPLQYSDGLTRDALYKSRSVIIYSKCKGLEKDAARQHSALVLNKGAQVLLDVGEDTSDIHHLHLRVELKNWVAFFKSTPAYWMLPFISLVLLFLDRVWEQKLA